MLVAVPFISPMMAARVPEFGGAGVCTEVTAQGRDRGGADCPLSQPRRPQSESVYTFLSGQPSWGTSS